MGGKVLLSEGTLNISALVALVTGLTLEGQGRATVLRRPDSTDAGLLQATSISGVTLSDFLIDGNKANNSTNRAPILFDTVSDSLIRDVRVNNALAGAGSGNHRAAIRLLSSTDCTLRTVRIDSPTGMGVALYSCGECRVEGAIVKGTSEWGIDVDGGSYIIVLEGNIVVGCTKDGIFVEEWSQQVNVLGNLLNGNRSGITLNQQVEGTLQRIAVVGNTCHSNGEHGIVVMANAAGTLVQEVTVDGNICTENGQSAADTFSGIKLGGHASGIVRGVVVTGNRCGDRQDTPTQKYGLHVESIVAGQASHNDLSNNVTAPLANASSNFKEFKNTGYVTENSGTATITNPATSVVVAHGLAVTPTVEDITVTLAENPTNDPGNIWVDTIGAANFTINCRNAPGVSNLDLAWKAVVL